MSRKKWTSCGIAAAVVFAIGIVILLAVLLSKTSGSPEQDEDVAWPDVGSSTGGRFPSAVVVSPIKICSSIGKQLLVAGGSAVDAAIGTCLCLGVVKPTSCGIGGGSHLIYYNSTSRSTHALDFREVAPRYAHRDLFVNSTLSATTGGASIAVPGEIAGYWVSHQKFGRLPWATIFQPSIDLCESGFNMTDYVYEMGMKRWSILSQPLKEHLINPSTNSIYNIGDNMTWKSLGATLRVLAREGAQAFYNGSLTAAILQDLRDCGSNITAEDLMAYRVEERTPVISTLRNGNFTLHSLPPPSGGVIVHHILGILDGFNLTKDSLSAKVKDIKTTVTTLHQIIESVKFGYGQRMKLGDMDFVDVSELVKKITNSSWNSRIRALIPDVAKETTYYGNADPKVTEGTCHVSVIAPDGDAVSVTSTVNLGFGSKQVGSRTGILFNNEMDDFSSPDSANTYGVPPSAANFIQPGKRPMSSMSPTIVTDRAGDVRIVAGSVGGSRIIAGVVWRIINDIWFGLTPAQSGSRPRIYHQLVPDVLLYEGHFPKVYRDGLQEKKHILGLLTEFFETSFNAYKKDGGVIGVADPRRPEAGADGF